jgi:hypothetical protein
MIYFKNENGEVFSYETQTERDKFGADDLVLMTQAEVIAHLSPPATYTQALDSLNAAYQDDVDKFNRSFALASLADGSSEAAKMSATRASYEARRAQHTANIAALKLEYGV